MNILAIDMGTKTGWALRSSGAISGGTQSFAPKRNENSAQRWLKFLAWLGDIRQSSGGIHAIYYEDVKNHAGVIASHVYGGFQALLEAFCESNRIPLHPVGVGQIKKHWTGKGNADKALMIRTAIEKGYKPVDDNHADALALLSYASEEQE